MERETRGSLTRLCKLSLRTLYKLSLWDEIFDLNQGKVLANTDLLAQKFKEKTLVLFTYNFIF